MKTTLTVEGMTCDGCRSSVTRALSSVPGVSNVEVSLEARRASVEHDARVTPESLAQAVRRAGFDAAPTDASA